MKTIVLKYSLILLVGLLVEWWIIWYSPLSLPERIPAAPIKIDGLLLVGLLLTILIIAEKRFLKNNPDTTIVNLTVLGTTICFIAEIIFQTIRQPFLSAEAFNERLHYFLLGTIGVTMFGAVFSFLVAFQLVRKKTGQLILLIIGFIVLINIVKYVFPTLGQ
jgi:hypothetical protein